MDTLKNVLQWGEYRLKYNTEFDNPDGDIPARLISVQQLVNGEWKNVPRVKKFSFELEAGFMPVIKLELTRV